MRKSKALSIMTSLAMTGTMVMSALPFTTSAATNPLGLALTAEQQNFTSAELASGKTVNVYVDAVGNVTEADKVGSVEFEIKSDSWGKVDPIDLILPQENALGTSKGFVTKEAFNQTATMVISQWDDAEKPKKAGYAIYRFNDVPEFAGYTDGYCPKVLIMSDSSHGFIKTDTAAGKHIAEFQVKLPAGLADGTYRLSLSKAKSMICVGGEFGNNENETVDAAVTDLVFTVGSGGTDQPSPGPNPTTTPTPTPTPTTTTTTQVTPAPAPITTTNGGNPDDTRIYDGTAALKVGEAAAAAAGETVDIPVYLELTKADPNFITGIAFKADYDKKALELTAIKDGDGFISDGSFNYDTETAVFMYTFSTEDILIDPTKPIATFTFKVKDGADADYKINLINHLTDTLGKDAKVQVIHTQYPKQAATYLTPTITAGNIKVGAGGSNEPGENPEDILWGDANLDGKVDVRDAALIAKSLAKGQADKLPINADYNRDGNKNVRDAAAIAKDLANGKIKKK